MLSFVEIAGAFTKKMNQCITGGELCVNRYLAKHGTPPTLYLIEPLDLVTADELPFCTDAGFILVSNDCITPRPNTSDLADFVYRNAPTAKVFSRAAHIVNKAPAIQRGGPSAIFFSPKTDPYCTKFFEL